MRFTRTVHTLASLSLLAGLSQGVLAGTSSHDEKVAAQLGPRPFFLIDSMEASPLKDKLSQCKSNSFYRSDLSIGHRGAPLQFPEHTRESYIAAAQMGAGVLECDVTFTKDKELVCRHSQKDLHTTTNILTIPELAEKCTVPPDFNSETPFKNVECRTSDITLKEFLSLKGKMDAGNPDAKTLEEYMAATPNYRTDLYSTDGTLLSHKQSIALFKELGVKMTPELKRAAVEMPYQGNYSQQDYAQQMIDEYKELGVDARNVYPQSFNIKDVQYWIANEPRFGDQAVYLDGRYDNEQFDHKNPSTWSPTMAELKSQGIEIIAPPMWMLVTIENGKISPSTYAKEAQKAGLDIITWTLERSGPLANGGGWYYQTTTESIDNDGDTFELLDVLVKDVGVIGVFSDWPATVTYYAGCTS
nr:glycerophosphodiester phosphodiesterase family protein [Motiliproteus sp. MSK22-1]